MLYRDYKITAEVETYETWEINEQGEATECIGSGDFFEITGYHFHNEKTDDDFFEALSAADVETLHELVDAHIKELA